MVHPALRPKAVETEGVDVVKLPRPIHDPVPVRALTPDSHARSSSQRKGQGKGKGRFPVATTNPNANNKPTGSPFKGFTIAKAPNAAAGKLDTSNWDVVSLGAIHPAYVPGGYKDKGGELYLGPGGYYRKSEVGVAR
jgi:hypothetical protein